MERRAHGVRKNERGREREREERKKRKKIQDKSGSGNSERGEKNVAVVCRVGLQMCVCR